MNPAGLYVVPKARKRKSAPKIKNSVPPIPAAATVEYLIAGATQVHTFVKPWKFPQTVDAIADWVRNYEGLLADGSYKPSPEFEKSPVPFRIRVKLGYRVVAEWQKPGERKVSA